jgi:integrase/recombinase XerD
MLTRYFKDPLLLAKHRQGPAGAYLDEFVDWLEKRGYRHHSIRRYIRGAHRFSLWAKRTGLTLHQLDSKALEAFGSYLQKYHRLKYPGGHHTPTFLGALQLVIFLEASERIVQPFAQSTPTSEPELLAAFRNWMKTQRGTTELTLNDYRPTLTELLQTLGDQPQQYNAHALRAFVLDRARGQGTGRAKIIVSAVRMFLRFLSAMGRCTPGLDDAIPTFARWRLASLPKYLSAEAVERIITSCDLTSPTGVRDRAVLLLLARLGLRAGDVARLTLAAIDWQAGTVEVAGKNRRKNRLPLPQEVGDAVLAYLDLRPCVSCEQVFITAIAPLKGLSSQTVGQIVRRAIRRAGVEAPIQGARVLRHSAATAMLCQGLTLPAIGAVLRHASIETTAIYAKVDLPLLRQVVRPWPEVTPC